MNPNNENEPNNEPNNIPANNEAFNAPVEPVVEQPIEQSTNQPLVEVPAQLDSTDPAPATPVEAAPLVAAAPIVTGAPAPKNKKLWPIIAIAAGALLLIAGGLLAYFLLTLVSKEDYRAAADQFNTVSSANSSLNSSTSSLNYSASRDTDEEFGTALKEAEDDLTKLKTENESFGKLKAVRFGDGAKLYKTFNDKLTAQLAFQSDYIASLKSIRPAMAVCKASSSATTATLTDALKKCQAALGDVKNIALPEIATYVSSLNDGYANYVSAYEKITKLTSPYGSQYNEYKTLRDQAYAAQDKVSDAASTYTDAIKKRQDELSVKDSADALATFLTDKQK